MANRFKIVVLAALMLIGMSAFSFAAGPSTTTVGLKVIPDVNQITATGSRTLNLSIMGLDQYGNVDTMGEAGGATIIAAVQSVLGTVASGGANPAAATGGSFATSTGYVLLNQGNGEANIFYPANVSGTDTITVILMKRWTEAGQTYTEEITRTSLSVDVAAGATSAGILNIESFTPANSDPQGATGTTVIAPANEAADTGITGAQMTAGVAGGIFEIKAYKINQDRSYTLDTTANGVVTLTLTGPATYSFNGTMSQGVAKISVPASVVKAGTYKVVATLGDINSVPKKISDNVATTDSLTVVADPHPVKVGLSVDRSIVSNTNATNFTANATTDGYSYDPTFSAYLLDKYGNTVPNNTGADIVVKVTDANQKVPDFNITITNGTTTGTATPDSHSFSAGIASLTASVPANTSIATSDPVSLNIVAAANQLMVNNNAIAGSIALTAFNATVGQTISNLFNNGIGVDSNSDYQLDGNEVNATLTATNKIKITNLASGESIIVGIKDGTVDNIDALFTKPADNGTIHNMGFYISDPDGSYAGFKILPSTVTYTAVNVGSPVKAYVKDAAGDVITQVVPEVLPDGSFKVVINGARVSMVDSYGNLANTGTLTINTNKGTATGTITVGNGTTNVTIIYPAGTTGEDQLTFNFTAPGIQSVNDGEGLTVKFPTVGTIDHFDAYIQDTTLPVNGIAPLTVIARDVNGNPVSLTNGFYVDYDDSVLNLFTTAGAAVAPGASVCAGQSRCVLEVDALTSPGSYPVTIKNADGSVTKEVEFNVVNYTASMSLSASSVSLNAGNSTEVTISGGVSPYSVSSSNSAVATASVSDNTVTITGVAAGNAVITVSDSNGQSATISVTVQGSAQPQPVPTQPTTTELSGSDIANAPVNMGPIATGGEKVMQLAVNFPPHEGAVDIYVGILLPNGTLYVLNSDGSLTNEIVPYVTNTTDAVSAQIFDSFPVCTPFGPAIPTGNYTVYALVVPAGTNILTMDWTSAPYDLTYYTFNVSCE